MQGGRGERKKLRQEEGGKKIRERDGKGLREGERKVKRKTKGDTLIGGDEKFNISSLSLRSCFMLFLGLNGMFNGYPNTGGDDGGKN